ncbi:anti-sigma factor [Cellulomonas xylanilytica]|uniref:Regulator of SigK n=1 Tax=Cellulomonas xylanilytica TaxID=233583 RepID=A0A510V557_9CELL|nr:anti-sigma factor [Cellulomonas xylanilytica]GEK21946.1 hypothetical protein CXY01_24660 [Cellulomonas xylanilytica]
MTTESSSFSGDDVRSLLGAYALDAVDADERAAVEHLVATDPSAAAELAQLTAVAATLGDAVAGEPPAALRASVLSAITGVPQVGPLAGPQPVPSPAQPDTATPPESTPDGLSAPPAQTDPTAASATPGGLSVTPATTPAESAPDGSQTSATGAVAPDVSSPGDPGATTGTGVTNLADRRRPSRTRWLAVAAALVVGAAVPTALAVQQAQRANEAEQQQQALADLLTDPSAVVVHGDVTGGGTATAVLTDDRALFSATGLPDPGDDKAYQLWVVDTDGAASAGVMADDAGSVRQLADDFSAGDALAITVEPAGGSTQPTTDPLVVLSTT